MKRKTNTTPTRIWTYGLPHGPDPECEPIVYAQIRAARVYKNKLTEIELERRKRYREARAACGGVDFAEIEAELKALNEAIDAERLTIKTTRKTARARIDPAQPQKTRIAELKEQRKACSERLRAARAALRESADLEAESKRIAEWANAERKAARATCGVFWGTYLLVETAADAAARSSTDPQFRRWDGSGRIGVQLQGGLTVEQLFACTDQRLRIAPVPKDAKRNTRHTRLQLRVGSEGRAPVWAVFSMVLHRPLPKDAVIKWAWAQRRKIGTRWRWEICLAVESCAFESPARVPTHAAGIDVGWRVVDDDGTLRIGYVVGTDGLCEEIQLPAKIRGRIEHARSLQSLRDEKFNIARGALALHLAGKEAPQWLTESSQHLSQWHSIERLSALVWRWRAERFDGDAEIFAIMDAWRRKDRHLLQWEASERSGAYSARREHYRLIATRLAKRYSTITIEKFNLRYLVKRAPAEDKKDEQELAQRHNRTLAALSEFRAALKLACSNAGTALVESPSAGTTTTCHVCGCTCKWDTKQYVVHKCEHCTAVWDQDENAARNLLLFSTRKAAA